ncbi:acetate kinase [Vulcanococcus limneticus Candia 3F8]|uniref:acetate/propionate family kinase n=1 Tax=Vulcanococcus limneticus TaxID=2170428 RepID=UPI000B99654F|nr:acetate kinase [Vulcanococcus limneticus]MCP9792577.1 acetate kinase [Vulcanococcus limneticus MW73D5]MCP9894208.1 acetate kinase [Vulcanococcus limneticus Candia 3F8]MCP9897969.1 acetate kinase [Vulcanococcus limneticus Candia 3B3]
MAPPELVLVLNMGSSSVKAALIWAGGTCRPWHGEQALQGRPVSQVLEVWLEPALAAWWPSIRLAGHRVVHGGADLIAPTRLGPAVLQQLEAVVPLAPLHNGPALEAIHWLTAQRPQLPQWACFDTAFHSSLTPAAYSYALPRSWREQGLRRFGFHGLNHQHVAASAADQWRAAGGEKLPRLVSCHLGAGCSLAAIREGRSVDTTMGYTPLDGLVMASRSGAVDPGLLLHQLRQGISPGLLDQVLSQESGLLGLSDLSGDWRELRSAAAAGHSGAALALDVFRHNLIKGIGAMAASAGGVDVVALSGGIGANDRHLLRELQEALHWWPAVTFLQIPADEEGMIARLCWQGEAELTNGR